MNSDTSAKPNSSNSLILLPEKRKIPEDDSDLWGIKIPNIPNLQIYWHTRSRLGILRHAYQNPNIEVGGVIIGRPYLANPSAVQADNNPYYFIEIVDFFPAIQSSNQSGQFEFKPEAWVDVNRKCDQKYPGEKIIGWYHTHPGHTVFLSPQDLFIHRNYFAQPFQMALVIDTHEHRGAFFVNSKQNESPSKSILFQYDLELARAQTSAPVQRASAPKGQLIELGHDRASMNEADIKITDDDLTPVPVQPLNRRGYPGDEHANPYPTQRKENPERFQNVTNRSRVVDWGCVIEVISLVIVIVILILLIRSIPFLLH